MTTEQILLVNDARLALRLHKTIAEIEAMPVEHHARLLQVLEHEQFMADMRAQRRGIRS